MKIVSFVHEGLGNSSYLLEVGSGRAILVDPDRVVGRYLEAASERGWEIAAVLETHLHADFVSGSSEVGRSAGATVHLPQEARASFPHKGAVPGDRLEIADVEIEVVGSPGHTPEHVSYVVRAEGEAPVLFSGGALIVGGAARTDLVDRALTEELTRAEFRTLRNSFAGLPDETVLLPTHGGGSFCSVAPGDARSSTLGEERAGNPLLALEDETAFARWFPTTFPGVPAYFTRMRDINRVGAPRLEEIEPPRPLPPDAFRLAMEAGALVVDVRPVRAYSEAHIPGSLSIPFRDAYGTWLGWLVPADSPLLFVLDGVPIQRVMEESLLVGYERFAGFLDGGLGSWARPGGTIARIEVAAAASAGRLLAEGAVAVDVREPAELTAGRVPGSVHIPLGELAGRLGELPRDRTLIAYCGHGERASTGVSILERAGFRSVVNLDGGFGGWKEAGID